MDYRVIVDLDLKTVSQLNKNKQRLIYMLSSSSNEALEAISLCSGCVDTFYNSNLIEVEDDNLIAYVTNSPLGDRKKIYIEQPQSNEKSQVNAVVGSTSHPIKLGQTFLVNSDLTYNIKTNSTENIIIQSDTTDQLTAGIGIIDTNKKGSPFYRGINAQILYKPSPLELAPASKILLAIMPNKSITTNMAVNKLSSNFIVIDLSENLTNPPRVTYSLSEGWGFDDTRVKKHESNDNLRSILITNMKLG